MEEYIAQRNNITVPYQLALEDSYSSNFGTDLNEIEPFTHELFGIVDKMKIVFADEKPILQGTEVPVYKPFEENEIQFDKSKPESWMMPLDHGSLRAGLIPALIPDSNTLSCTAKPSNQNCHTVGCDAKSSNPQTDCFKETSEGCGCATDAMNESSDCTVPMISEQMDGTPSEEK